MSHIKICGPIALSLAFCLLSEVHAGFGSKTKVKVNATASKIDGQSTQTIIVSLKVDKDWHIYANPVDHTQKILNNSKTVVVVKGPNVKSFSLQYPKGILKKDDTFGEYKIYKDDVKIKAVVQRSSAEASPLEISVRFSACSDVEKKCLSSSTVKISLE